MLYHYGLVGLSGGFVGVDIFFVLSGYLIGGQLQGELRATGRIDLRGFWLRRIRRLAPAFFAMLAVTVVAAWLVLLPAELRAFGKEMIAATGWASNILFWRDAGYFDAASDLKPLLHTWSLSVEEQFYLLIPLVCLGLARIGGFAWGLGALWALSLVACVWLTPAMPSATFFLFPFRAWEMLTGGLLALYLARENAARLPPIWGVAGLGIIAFSLATAVAGDSFPGWQAILPVAGTVLVLAARDTGPVARLLSHPWPVALGLVSYAVYLWHWPVVVLSRYWRGEWQGALEGWLWLAVSLVLALIAFVCVERPLRRAPLRPLPWFGGFAAGVALFMGIGLWFWKTDGLPARFGPLAQAHILASQDFIQDWTGCTTPESGPFAGLEICPIGPPAAIEDVRILIWGDSHLRAMKHGLMAEATAPALMVWHAGCPPFIGIGKTETAATPAQDAACSLANTRMAQAIAAMKPDTLLLIGRWRYYADGQGIGRDSHNRITLQGADYATAWANTVAALSDDVGRIVVMRQVPELPDYDSRTVAQGLVHGHITPAQAAALGRVDAASIAAANITAEAPLRELAAQGRITLIDSWPALCDSLCSALPEGAGQGLYFDNNHLTNHGAMRVAPLLRAVLAGDRAGNPTGDFGAE